MARFDEIKQLQFCFTLDEEELNAFDKVIKLLDKIADEIEERKCGDIYYKGGGLDYILPIDDIKNAATTLETVRDLSGDFLDID